MKKQIRAVVGRLYKPLLVKYLSKTRFYRFRGIQLLVPKEVFHPGFFFSTKQLLQFLRLQPLKGRTLLELGAGSGLLAFSCARDGARVTATDINPIAIQYLKKNALVNGAVVQIIESDLFTKIPPQAFDIIAINPPYYRKTPVSLADHAWFCGENGEYFNGLFAGLRDYSHTASDIWIILCDGCDLEMIHGLARQHGWMLDCVQARHNLLETNFIFHARRIVREAIFSTFLQASHD